MPVSSRALALPPGGGRRASPGAQMVRNLLVMQETWVRSLGRADPMEKEVATHSSSLAWRMPWTQEPRGLQSIGSQSRIGLSD